MNPFWMPEEHERWLRLAVLAARGQHSENAVMRCAAALLQAHLLVDVLAGNLLLAMNAEDLLGDEVILPDGTLHWTGEEEYERKQYDRLYAATLNDESSAVMMEHLLVALEVNC